MGCTGNVRIVCYPSDNVFTDSVTQMATLGIFLRPVLPIITEGHATMYVDRTQLVLQIVHFPLCL